MPYCTLSWSDFKGKPDNSTTIARSYTGIVIEKDTAYAYFNSERSWTRTSDCDILRHEQLHFAITKFWAKEISNWLVLSHKIVGTYDDGISARLNMWDRDEDRYDRETNHGLNMEAQKQWEQKIKL